MRAGATILIARCLLFTVPLLTVPLLTVPLLTVPLLAADPELDEVLPRGGARGTTIAIELRGERLADAEELLFEGPGLRAENIRTESSKGGKRDRVHADLIIAADAPLGEHVLRLRTRSGLSPLGTLWVGPFPELPEVEPNSDADSAQLITIESPGRTITGVIENEDVDLFAFDAEEGQSISLELEGLRLGGTLFDPRLAIIDAARFEVASCDDSSLHLQDPVLVWRAPKTDRYWISVRSSAFEGSSRAHYRLHVGDYSRPTVVFPAGGERGENLTVRFLGENVPACERAITVDDRPLFPGEGTPSPVAFRVTDFPSAGEVEPNRRREDATPVTLDAPFGLDGIIAEAGDHDWFRFPARKGITYGVVAQARSVRSPLDAVINIFAPDGKHLVGNDDSGGLDSRIRWQAPADGEYYVRVRDHRDRGGETFVYRLEIEPVAPSVTLSIPQVRRYSQREQVAPVPRGNRIAVLLRAERSDHGGPIEIRAEGLPAGVRMVAPPIPAGQDLGAVLFEVDEGVADSGAWASFTAWALDGTRLGDYHQPADLVVAPPNNTVYYRAESRGMAVAVVGPAPFSVALAIPAGPLVRDGDLVLTLVAERRDGFDGPIDCRLIQRPPGVGAPGNVRIPKGQDRASFTINANDKAALGEWPLVIVAAGNAGAGTVRVSSEFATLRVEEPYVVVRVEMAAVVRGEPIDVVCPVEVKRPFEGLATAELIGLPPGCQAPRVEFGADRTNVVFPVTTSADSPVGRHNSLFVRVEVPVDGQPTIHRMAGRQVLRIDAPRAEPVVRKAPPTAEPGKRESRIEKLRREYAERRRREAGVDPEPASPPPTGAGS